MTRTIILKQNHLHEYPGMEEKLLEIINHYEIQDKVIIQSFSEESLQKFIV